MRPARMSALMTYTTHLQASAFRYEQHRASLHHNYALFFSRRRHACWDATLKSPLFVIHFPPISSQPCWFAWCTGQCNGTSRTTKLSVANADGDLAKRTPEKVSCNPTLTFAGVRGCGPCCSAARRSPCSSLGADWRACPQTFPILFADVHFNVELSNQLQHTESLLRR